MTTDLEVTHCPVCSREYGADAFMCPDDGTALVAGPADAAAADAPAAATTDALAQPEADEDADVPQGALTVLDPATDDTSPVSLFEQEEHPERMILANIARSDADEFIAKLEAEGVGAKLGEPTEEDGVEILIHEPNIAVAQAVLVDFTGDESLADDIEPEGGNDDGLVEVGRFSMLDAQAHIDRLRRAGIDVTLRPPPPDTPPMLAAAIVSVAEDDASRARTILGITR